MKGDTHRRGDGSDRDFVRFAAQREHHEEQVWYKPYLAKTIKQHMLHGLKVSDLIMVALIGCAKD